MTMKYEVWTCYMRGNNQNIQIQFISFSLCDFSQWLRCYCTGHFKWNSALHMKNPYKYITESFLTPGSIIITQTKQTKMNIQKTFSIFTPNLVNNSRTAFYRNSFLTFLLKQLFSTIFRANLHLHIKILSLSQY